MTPLGGGDPGGAGGREPTGQFFSGENLPSRGPSGQVPSGYAGPGSGIADVRATVEKWSWVWSAVTFLCGAATSLFIAGWQAHSAVEGLATRGEVMRAVSPVEARVTELEKHSVSLSSCCLDVATVGEWTDWVVGCVEALEERAKVRCDRKPKYLPAPRESRQAPLGER